ncbi:TorF family putative porin [Bacteroidota bacterium]
MKRTTYLPVILFISVFLLSPISKARAQDEKTESPISIGADIVSRYVWRGLDYGASPSIQPYVEAGFGGFAIGAWGAYTTNLPGVQEMDLYMNYTINEIVTIGVIDYFFPKEVLGYDYYEFRKDLSNHVIEGIASFNGLENLPLSATLGVNLFNDSNNSIYFELGYSFSILDVFMGLGNGVYSTDTEFGLVNLGISASKEIPITDNYGLPISASLITNPNAKQIHLVFGISF